MKSWYKSRTIWLGVGTIITAVVTACLQGAGWEEGVLAAVGALSILLRAQTNLPIATRKTPG